MSVDSREDHTEKSVTLTDHFTTLPLFPIHLNFESKMGFDPNSFCGLGSLWFTVIHAPFIFRRDYEGKVKFMVGWWWETILIVKKKDGLVHDGNVIQIGVIVGSHSIAKT